MRHAVRIIASFCALLFLPPLAAHASPPGETDEGSAGWRKGGAADPIPYVIVTSKHLRPEFARLARRHTADGLRAEVRTLESIRADDPGAADDPERIRRFLQDAWRDRGTRWVLLGGDASVVPIRRMTWPSSFRFEDRVLPTDLYYARLDGPGPAEGDSTWSAAAGGSILRLGRAPVADREQARRFVERTLDALDRRGPAAAPGVLLAAGSLGAGPAVIDFAVQAEALRPLFEGVPGAHVARLYAAADAWPGSYPESRGALIDSLERGYDLAVLYGAGGPGEFAAGGSLDPADRITGEDALALRGSGRPTRCAFVSGYTCAPGPAPSIGAGLVNGEDGGTVSVLGPTWLMWTHEAEFVRRFFEELVDRAAATGGEALARVQAVFPPGGTRLAPLTMCLFGDPALPWWPVRQEREPAPAARLAETASTGDAQGVAVLGPPRPNPARGGVRLELSIPAALAGPRPFEARVFDPAGRRVRDLARGTAAAGRIVLEWDLRGEGGEPVRPGLYLVRSRVAGTMQVRRVVVAG